MIMRELTARLLGLITSGLLLTASCSKPPEDPFSYPFFEPLHIKRESGKPYSEYKAFYVLTEDFEPALENISDVEQMREILQFASTLSLKRGVPWTHFVDVNTLASAFISEDTPLKQQCTEMIGDLKRMAGSGDDFELHLHGPLNRRLLEYLRSTEKLRVASEGMENVQGYRRRKSFFFKAFYRAGYHDIVTSLAYGKRLLENAVYDGRSQVLAFRPGAWDDGSSQQDVIIYFSTLREAGLIANSGLAVGEFGTPDWRVGNYPGHNVATVKVNGGSIREVSPTSGPGGYLNPVSHSDLNKLADSKKDEMPVIVSVYHLGALRGPTNGSEGDEGEHPTRSNANAQRDREALERHFETVAELRAKKVLYPITLRELLPIIADQK